ncbi:MAG: ribonuclease HII [Crocinitomicaceae bacterium]|nr:ribonuclease HII [Crocinitomicaceae bacterium]
MSLKQYKHSGLLAGCDEAGRGCLAGPVVAAAVILPPKFKLKGLNDSKKLTEKMRNELFPQIKEKAIAWGVGMYSPKEIDEVNILNASFYSMHRAIDKLDQVPSYILVDGNRFIPYKEITHECVIKGDGKYLSIAAASILAKVTRDRLMEELDLQFPVYDWKKNKGYPTVKHRAAIKEFGTTEHHRQSFKLLPEEQLSLNL